MAQAVVGKAQLFGKHPALAVVLGEKGIEAFFLKVVEGDHRQDGVAQLRGFVLIDAPEPLLVERLCISLYPQKRQRIIRIF
ncbi:hypothetical protein D9M68_879270 [compost metagenome]